MAGAIIWDSVLIAYGYYLLSSKSAEVVLASVGVLAILIYVIYRVATRRLHKR